MQSRLRATYATLLQIEYILALATSYLLGAKLWVLFITCLALTLLIGFGTTAMYWKLMDRAKDK